MLRYETTPQSKIIDFCQLPLHRGALHGGTKAPPYKHLSDINVGRGFTPTANRVIIRLITGDCHASVRTGSQ